MAGPRGDVDKERAGDPGEYHHSRNLTKKMAVGSSNRSESRSRRGEVTSRCRSRPLSDDELFGAARERARCQHVNNRIFRKKSKTYEILDPEATQINPYPG